MPTPQFSKGCFSLLLRTMKLLDHERAKDAKGAKKPWKGIRRQGNDFPLAHKADVFAPT
jgi:hypothetical protein